MNFKNCAGICLMLLCLALCQSCRKGCTNVRAFNYQASAKEDDGSCLYCDSAVTAGFGQNISVEDLNPGSPYQYNYVIFATVNSNSIVYNGNGCKLQGHDNTGSGCSTTFYVGTLQNQTSTTVTFSGTIQVYQYGLGNTVNFPVYNVIIPPSSYVNVNLGQGGCLPQFSSFSISVLSPTFSYH